MAIGVRRTVRESLDFTPTGTRAERVHMVNVRGAAKLFGRGPAGVYFCSARLVMSSMLMRPRAAEKLRSASASAGRTTSLTSADIEAV